VTSGDFAADDLERLRAVVRNAPGASSDAAWRHNAPQPPPRLDARTAVVPVPPCMGLRFSRGLPVKVPGRRPIRPDVVFSIWEHESVAVAVPRVCELLAAQAASATGAPTNASSTTSATA
jgi:hypothetical protein